MRFFIMILCLLVVLSCSRIHITKGTEREKPKIHANVSENCKVRVKVSRQGVKCKWRF
jgi:hypothetical protein